MSDKKVAQLTQIDGIVSGDWFVVGDTSATDNAKKASPDQVRSGLSLGNVTNDAQLKRTGDDFSTFTAKTNPEDADLILIEDSGASNAKKKSTVGSLRASVPRTYTFSSASSLTPNINSYDLFFGYEITGDITINQPSGSAVVGRKIAFLFNCTVGINIYWNAIYTDTSGHTKPSALSSTTSCYVEFVYDSDRSKWICTTTGTY